MNWQPVADSLRTVGIPLSVITATICVRVAVDRTYRTFSQLCRFCGLAFLCFALALGQYHSLGRPPFWLALILLQVGLVASLAGTLPLALSRNRSASLKAVTPEEPK